MTYTQKKETIIWCIQFKISKIRHSFPIWSNWFRNYSLIRFLMMFNRISLKYNLFKYRVLIKCDCGVVYHFLHMKMSQTLSNDNRKMYGLNLKLWQAGWNEDEMPIIIFILFCFDFDFVFVLTGFCWTSFVCSYKKWFLLVCLLLFSFFLLLFRLLRTFVYCFYVDLLNEKKKKLRAAIIAKLQPSLWKKKKIER